MTKINWKAADTTSIYRRTHWNLFTKHCKQSKYGNIAVHLAWLLFLFIFFSFFWLLALDKRLIQKCPSVPSITLHLRNMHMYTAWVLTELWAAGKHFYLPVGVQMALG